MKLLKDNGTILEIYAGEINETQVNNKTGWGNKTTIEIKLISDQVEFRKVFQIDELLLGDYYYYFYLKMRDILNKNLGRFSVDKNLANEIFNLEEMFEEALRLTKTFFSLAISSISSLFKEEAEYALKEE